MGVKRVLAVVALWLGLGIWSWGEKGTLPTYVLQARTVAVMVDPDAGFTVENPHANQQAQKDVETALLNWGRFKTVMGPDNADLVIVIKKGTGKIVNETVTTPRANSRVGTINPTADGVSIGAQHGRQPGLESAGAADGKENGARGPHPQMEIGSADDSFVVYEGQQPHAMERVAAWRWVRKDGLHPHDVPAVGEFRKALAEAEKAAAKQIAAKQAGAKQTANKQALPSEARPGFEVASVRQNKAGGPQHSNVPLDTGNVYSTLSPSDTRSAAGGYFVAVNQPLWRYIAFAYRLSGTQELALRFSYFEGLKSKAPKWVTGGFDVSADRFNIEARGPANATIDDMRLMMQTLLAERFQLVVHQESREAPALGLVLVHAGVRGPNLQPHSAADGCAEDIAPQKKAGGTGQLPPLCGVIAHVSSSNNQANSFGGRGVPLSLLATSLPTMTGMAAIPKPVVDQTGLAGLYDFTLDWNASTDLENGDTAVFFREALRAQLGLELKPTRASISILVIDSVERPSEN